RATELGDRPRIDRATRPARTGRFRAIVGQAVAAGGEPVNLAKSDAPRAPGETTPSTLVRVNGQPSAAIDTMVGFRTDDHARLDRVQNVVSGVCAALAGAALVAITVLTVAEVVVRNFFNSPLGWNVGFVEQYLMTAMAFFGLVTAY